MPIQNNRMSSIIERDEDVSSEAPLPYLKSELTLKNLSNRNRFNNKTMLDSPSKVEPMIKQMKDKREKITGKNAVRITDL